MFIQKKQNLKRFTHICLSFTSILLSAETRAIENPSRDYIDESVTSKHFPISPSKSEVGDATEEHGITQRNNLIGVALFSGKDPVSYGIKGLTNSKTSHVGIILADAQDENLWYCFEATGSAGEVLRGHLPAVQITPWDFVVKEYHGNVSYRLAIFEDKDRPNSKKIGDFVKEYNHKPFTRNPFRLFKAWLRKNSAPKSSSLKTVFCSELTAKMLMDLDVLNKGIPGNYIPKDFSSKSSIVLRSGITLTPEFKVK